MSTANVSDGETSMLALIGCILVGMIAGGITFAATVSLGAAFIVYVLAAAAAYSISWVV